MSEDYMSKFDVVVGVIVMILTIFSVVFFVKCEENKYSECKYLVIDSHKFQYHAMTYKVLDNSCVSLVDEDKKTIIICGQYTIEETKK